MPWALRTPGVGSCGLWVCVRWVNFMLFFGFCGELYFFLQNGARNLYFPCRSGFFRNLLISSGRLDGTALQVENIYIMKYGK